MKGVSMGKDSGFKAFTKSAQTTGELIKAFRNNFAISQSAVVAATGIPQSALSLIENDERELTATTALKLAAFFGVNPVILLYPSGYEQEADFVEVRRRAAALRLG